MDFEFLDPLGSGNDAAFEPAARVPDLRGKTVGLLDNGKTNADKFLRMVAKILSDEFEVGEVKMYHKATLSKPAPLEVIEQMSKEVEVAVTGIGDCGSCSTNSVHDAIELEKLGVPTVAVCTEAFRPGLQTLTKMRGMPKYRFAIVPHPLGVLFDDKLQERAELAAPQVVQILNGTIAD